HSPDPKRDHFESKRVHLPPFNPTSGGQIRSRREHEMAMRSALTSLPACLRVPSAAAAAAGGRRPLSDGKGRVLSEEERAKEGVYIQKMERERQEKLKKKLEHEKTDADKTKPADSDKKPEGSN
ncbi:unnamed protein product, partial [Urochloa humidicola]